MSRAPLYDLGSRYGEPRLRRLAPIEPNALLRKDSVYCAASDAGTLKVRHTGDVRTCMRRIGMMNPTERLQINREVASKGFIDEFLNL